ncbi:hypothetical protein GCM10010293_42900 [Streptomyces griseoflavus]|nr:hypothetical protein GCM10010293_42900 [Streptomyces griseoflavus]
MSSPALPVLRRPPAPTVEPAGGSGTAPPFPHTPLPAVRRGQSRPAPGTVRAAAATPVTTEPAAGATTRTAPRCAGVPDVRPVFRPGPARVPLTVPDGHPPVPAPGAALQEHGPGPGTVDALSEAWGRTPTVPAGKTARARSSAHPPI